MKNKYIELVGDNGQTLGILRSETVNLIKRSLLDSIADITEDSSETPISDSDRLTAIFLGVMYNILNNA